MMLSFLYLLKCVVGVSFIALCAKFLWKKLSSNSPNPFKVKTSTTVRPLVTDKEARKAVLKKAFRSDLVPQQLDAVVIGSGIGGLVCAGLLSRAGKRVLVLEQHDRAGGCTHTYKTKGCEFDVGIHYVGNIEKGSMNRCLMDLLTDNQLEWVEIDENFDTVVFNKPGTPIKNFPFTKGHQDFKKQLLAQFPDEENAISKFFALLKVSRSASNVFVVAKILPKILIKIFLFLQLDKIFFAKYNYVAKTSLKDVLDSLTTNDRLKAILVYPFGDYGAAPDETCFFMHAMLINHLYRKGGFYPKGGASEIAFQMIPGIVKGGGAVLTQAKVQEILIENGAACGVKLTLRNGSSHTIRAPNVISGAGIYNTYKQLLPQHVVDNYNLVKKLDSVHPGLSCLQILVGLDGTKEELNLPSKNFWIFLSDNPGKDLHDYLAMSREEALNSPIPLLFVSFPSAKDPTWESRYPGKSSCIVITLSSLSWFAEWKDEKVKKRGAIYDGLKSSFMNQAWNQVLERFPNLKDKTYNMVTGTPLTHVHYLNSMHGEIYGINHNKERFSLDQAMDLRPETPIPGLYLTGQDVFTCGFMGGAFGGVLSASSVLNRYLLIDWVNAVKEERKKK